jgi:hypothetical protein
MLKTIALIFVAALAALLIFAATRPDVFRVERRISINASPEKIFGLINDMKQFNAWNPYNRKDPGMNLTYRGPQAGPGAAFDFSGNKDVGKGSLAIFEASAPGKVSMKLDMIEPFEGHNVADFTIVPRGASSEVSWAMHGPSPFIGKLMGIIFNMDRMIGKDFEAGLADLKTLAERGQ